MIDLFSRVVAFPAGQVKLSEGKDVNCILHPGWYPFQAVLINYLPSESTSFSLFSVVFHISQYVPNMSHRFPKKSNVFLEWVIFPSIFQRKLSPRHQGSARTDEVVFWGHHGGCDVGSYNDLHRNPLVYMVFFFWILWWFNGILWWFNGI